MIHINELDAYGESIKDMRHEPLKITFNMRSPVVTADYIFLDGLLSSAVFKDCVQNHSDMLENRSDVIHIPLPLKQYGSVKPFYAASIGFAEDIVESTDRWRKRTEIESSKKLQIGSGQYKIYDIPVPTLYADSWFFFANGNKEEIKRLLKLHISAIGKKCSQGFGAINSIAVEPYKHDWSVVRDGAPMRPIPILESNEFNLTCDVEMYFAYRPPYWHTKNMAMCYMPLCRV